MTTYVNIPQSKTDDANYRYKMPQMKLSQESRLNGVKTNITNLPDVARALRVPESVILKYFCSEVGANAEGTTIVKGQHTLQDLARHLDKFIMKYVCCKKCKLPEITHEVTKKNLVGVCRSCGTTDNKMDTMHKAGKLMLKDIPLYYAANPEFGSKKIVIAVPEEVAPASKGGKRKGGKVRKDNSAAAEEETKVSVAAKKERAQKLAASGGEVNILDAQTLLLTDQSIVDACQELKTFVAEKEAEGAINCNDIVREARQLQLQLNVTPEYKLYLCIAGIFGAHRNIVKHWDEFEKVFTTLVAQDQDNGVKHLFQAVIQFFINLQPESQKFAAALCKKLYDNSVIEDQMFIKWHAKQMKLDRDSKLHDRQAESAMRPLLNEFIQWLSSAEYDDEQDYGEEEAAGEEQEETKQVEETEAERNQRELIEAQKKAQAEKLASAKAAGAEQKKKAEEAEEQKRAADAEAGLEQIQSTTKVADIAVDDDFDINDI